MATTTQPIKWHGGKHYLAPWILEQFPDRSRYTHYLEPFAGGLSVLFAHDPDGKSEAVNDLNGGLSNFWHVLATDPDELMRRLNATPLSQQVWEDAATLAPDHGDRVASAVRFFIRYRQSRQGLGKDYCTPTGRTRRGMNENVSAWLSAVDGLPEAHQRLRRVEVRNMDAVEFIRRYDHPKALFYLDPPYIHTTRVTHRDYECEMSLADHARLLECLTGIEGLFCLSGYGNELYQQFATANGWHSVSREIDNKASSKPTKEIKVEVLWMNYANR